MAMRRNSVFPVFVLGVLGALFSVCPVSAGTCEPWVARVVSAQGTVEARKAGATEWRAVQIDDAYCAGDLIRVQERSRAAIILPSDAVLRLDQNTTIVLPEQRERDVSLIELLRGAVHFISRVTRGLKVTTPFLNAGVEGTEFLVTVTGAETFVGVLEGRVKVENAAGALTLSSGQSARAPAGQAPVAGVPVRSPDAVQWALYYPVVVERPPAQLPAAPPGVRDPAFFTLRAATLLAVGRLDEARVDIEQALALEPQNARALALKSIIAVARNQKEEALRLGNEATTRDPSSAVAWIALSYAQQAAFDLKNALASVEEAVKRDSGNSLAWARLSELRLSFGDVSKALAAARTSRDLNPDLARAQTVVGFASLVQFKITAAKEAFDKAIALDSADPLPRLGRGLALIRAGDLAGGRREIEIAAGLDPARSIVRSYLGKAYYEERRDKPAREEFATAQALDRNDPTPLLYGAIQKESGNRPVEALRDLQTSIELNDNRAVYRSRLQLDEDLAVRSAGLGRIYNDLGFQQLALVEGWKSLNADPANYSAHRFLSDSYAVLPRHEVARVSELLQAQLLQPVNINPVQPQIAADKLFILQGAALASPAFNEYNALFERDRFSFLASGIFGGNGTFGDELVHSGVIRNLSYSLGQFHYETLGFRKNSDLTHDIYDAFAQVSLGSATSVQTEFRSSEFERGDLVLRFDPTNVIPDIRQQDQIDSVRVGFRQLLAPNSTLIGSFGYQSGNFDVILDAFGKSTMDVGSYSAEVQHLFRSERFSLISGIGQAGADRKTVDNFLFLPLSVKKETIDHTNVYTYAYLNYLKSVTLTLGASADFFAGGIVDSEQFNPKGGVTWNPIPGTTVRAAAFRTFRRTLLSSQTVEPTQVAGFNQLFDDAEGTDAWRYGVGVDQKIAANLYAGAEFSRRDLSVPSENVAGGAVVLTDVVEQLGRTYLYWTPESWVAVSAEYQYERLRSPGARNPEAAEKVRTHRFPLGVEFFPPGGVAMGLKGTVVAQDGSFVDLTTGETKSGTDQFVVLDLSARYRLPRRFGLISCEVRNLLDQRFHFSDTDPANPSLYPERLVLGKLTLAY